MTRTEHLKFCKFCTKKDFDRSKGVICTLTGDIADFIDNCPDYVQDGAIVSKEKERTNVKEEDEKKNLKVLYSFLMTVTLPIIFTIALVRGGVYKSILVYLQDIFMGALIAFIFSTSLYRLHFFEYRFKRAIGFFGEKIMQYIILVFFGAIILVLVIWRFFNEFEI
jgi:hypothetical protein